MKSRLACKESIAYLWGYPDEPIPRRPETKALFKAIAEEAEMCIRKTDWEDRIRRIENILAVIKWRIHIHWEEMQWSDVDRLIQKAKRECDPKEEIT